MIQERVEDMPTKPPKIINILLVGKTGVGKSATGNSILGKTVFEEDSGGSVTSVCTSAFGRRFNQDVCVIDTPGACDTTKKESLKIIDDYISMNMCEIHAICLVISSCFRPTEEDLNAIASLCKLLGPAMLAYMLVVVTSEGRLRQGYKKKTPRDFLLDYTAAGAEILQHCVAENRFVGLENYDDRMKDEQVRTLLQKVQDIVAKQKGALYKYSHFKVHKEALAKEKEMIQWKEQKLKEEKEEEERRIREEWEEKKRRDQVEWEEQKRREQEEWEGKKRRERVEWEEQKRREQEEWEEKKRRDRKKQEENTRHDRGEWERGKYKEEEEERQKREEEWHKRQEDFRREKEKLFWELREDEENRIRMAEAAKSKAPQLPRIVGHVAGFVTGVATTVVTLNPVVGYLAGTAVADCIIDD